MKTDFQALPHMLMCITSFPFNLVKHITLSKLLIKLSVDEAMLCARDYRNCTGSYHWTSYSMHLELIKCKFPFFSFFPSLFSPFLSTFFPSSLPSLSLLSQIGLATEFSSAQNHTRHGKWRPHNLLVYKLQKGSFVYFSTFEIATDREIISEIDLMGAN